MSWTNTGGGDHGGDDWTLSVNTNVSGVHYNIGTFKVNTSCDAILVQGAVFEVHAESIDIDGRVYGAARGYLGFSGSSNGEGTGGGEYGNVTTGAGGGGYGGDGGDGYNNADSGGITYGGPTTTRALMGSGGGGSGSLNATGGNGGGCVRFYCDDIDVAATGIIIMDGETGEESGGYYSGGGSGGGIYIVCNTCTFQSGSSITANGGAGPVNYDDSEGGGVGGGGRIKICYYGTYINNGTVTASKGTGAFNTGASDGTVQSFKAAYCNSTYSVGQTFKTTASYESYISSVILYANSVLVSGDFTLKIWDSTSKTSELASKTITISSTGEKTFEFSSPVLLDADTTYYLELNPDSTGEIQVAVDAYSAELQGTLYYGGYIHTGFDIYMILTGLGHVSDPVVYNTADPTVKCYIANEMLVGAVHRINADGTGSLTYADDFTTVKYTADKHDLSGVSHDTTDDELDIADGGYIEYYFDCRYPITSIPTLTGTFNITSGTPTIQISADGATWYDIDTAIVDGVETVYELDNATNLNLKNALTAFYLRFDCTGADTNTVSVIDFEVNVEFVTIDSETPLVRVGETNTFRCDVDTASALDFELDIIFRDRKWAG